ncbi:MAG: hypothetical protein ACI378_11655 [Bacteroides sp.]
MRKLIYFLCCMASICVAVYMCYESWLLIEARHFSLRDIMFMLGSIGWLVITFNIVTRQYRWANYLCK